PQDRISAYIAADYFSKFAAAPKNLLSAVANDCKGLHLSYDAVEVINTRCSLRHNYSFAAKDNERFFDEDEREFYMQSSSMINEYRYAKDGKLFRIDGFITHASEVFKVVKNKKVLIKNAMDGLIEQSERDSLYRIYFFPDKTRKIYFGQSQKSSSDLNYLEKYNLIKNNDLKYLAEYEKKIWDKYGGKDEQKLQTFNRNMGYVKRILSASDEELQKEFDEIYKKNFRPIEIKEGRCDYDY
ncbi:MAG: hypothetical protein LBS26_06655, partial [Campylobacteraceae bacterium]|nr:hypothetical protein [Campylobacteraceae bacterium]